jgi:Na+/H+-dicarboxylate symporter
MVLGAVAGVTVGAQFGDRWAEPNWEPLVLSVRLLGVVFLSMLKALVVPLIVTSVVLSVARMGDLRRLGHLAGLTATFFVGTTILSVSTGLVVVNWIRPGVGGAQTAAASADSFAGERSPAQAVYEVVTGMFPNNLVGAAVDGNILGLIVFSLAAGAMLTTLGARSRIVIDMLDVANDVLLRLVTLVVWLAPLGIFGLVADRLGRAGGGASVWNEVAGLGWYAGTVLLGLGIHAFVSLPLVLLLVARRNPLRYLAGMGDALITAFGTASSAATLGVTLECVTKRNGVSERAAEFVVPLGTTVNMDGTALYEAVAVLFIAQTMGIELPVSRQLVVLVTATLAAIGAAAIPEAGLVTMVLVLTAVGLPAEGVGLILSIDWILDRFRTAVNVWGDSVGAAVVDRRMASG